ncbi:MAG: hypothetical protein WCV62_03170 [Candidatus Peribacteraceae bacterium]
MGWKRMSGTPQAVHRQLVRHIREHGRQKAVPQVVAAAVLDERHGLLAPGIGVGLDDEIDDLLVDDPLERGQVLQVSQVVVVHVVQEHVARRHRDGLGPQRHHEQPPHPPPQERALHQDEPGTEHGDEQDQKRHGMDQHRAGEEEFVLHEEEPRIDHRHPQRRRQHHMPHFRPRAHGGAQRVQLECGGERDEEEDGGEDEC